MKTLLVCQESTVLVSSEGDAIEDSGPFLMERSLRSVITQGWAEEGMGPSLCNWVWEGVPGKLGILTASLEQPTYPDTETLANEWDWTPCTCRNCACGTPHVLDYRVFRVEQVTESSAKRIVSLLGAL